MEHREEFQFFASDSIGDDIRSTGYDQCTSSRDSTRSTNVWLRSQESPGVENLTSDTDCTAWIIFGNIVTKRNQIVDRTPRPDNGHLDALPSEG